MSKTLAARSNYPKNRKCHQARPSVFSTLCHFPPALEPPTRAREFKGCFRRIIMRPSNGFQKPVTSMSLYTRLADPQLKVSECERIFGVSGSECFSSNTISEQLYQHLLRLLGGPHKFVYSSHLNDDENDDDDDDDDDDNDDDGGDDVLSRHCKPRG